MPLDARDNIPACVLFRACAGRAQQEAFGFELIPLQRLRSHELHDERCLWFREFWSDCHRLNASIRQRDLHADDYLLPLHAAVASANKEAYRSLIGRYPDVSARYGYIPQKEDARALVELALKNSEMELDPTRVTELCPFSCLTPAMIVAAHGHVPLLKEMLACNPAIDLNARCAAGWTPLHWAAYRNQAPMARFLLSKDGVNCLPRTARRGWMDEGKKGLSPHMIAQIGNKARAGENQNESMQSNESVVEVLDALYNARRAVVLSLRRLATQYNLVLPQDVIIMLADSFRFDDPTVSQPHVSIVNESDSDGSTPAVVLEVQAAMTNIKNSNLEEKK